MSAATLTTAAGGDNNSPPAAYQLAALHSIAMSAVASDWPTLARAELAELLVDVAATFEDAEHRATLRGIAAAVAGDFRVLFPTPRHLAWEHHA